MSDEGDNQRNGGNVVTVGLKEGSRNGDTEEGINRQIRERRVA